MLSDDAVDVRVIAGPRQCVIGARSRRGGRAGLDSLVLDGSFPSPPTRGRPPRRGTARGPFTGRGDHRHRRVPRAAARAGRRQRARARATRCDPLQRRRARAAGRARSDRDDRGSVARPERRVDAGHPRRRLAAARRRARRRLLRPRAPRRRRAHRQRRGAHLLSGLAGGPDPLPRAARHGGGRDGGPRVAQAEPSRAARSRSRSSRDRSHGRDRRRARRVRRR